MKHVFLNLKRFDVPAKTGGVNRLTSPAEWGSFLVKATQNELTAFDPVSYTHLLISDSRPQGTGCIA